jgi:hypothetical protein
LVSKKGGREERVIIGYVNNKDGGTVNKSGRRILRERDV